MVTDVQIKWKTFIVEWRLPTLFYRKSAGTTPERNLHPFQIRLQPLQVNLLTAQFELQPMPFPLSPIRNYPISLSIHTPHNSCTRENRNAGTELTIAGSPIVLLRYPCHHSAQQPHYPLPLYTSNIPPTTATVFHPEQNYGAYPVTASKHTPHPTDEPFSLKSKALLPLTPLRNRFSRPIRPNIPSGTLSSY